MSLARRALEAARTCGLDWLPGMLAQSHPHFRNHDSRIVEVLDGIPTLWTVKDEYLADEDLQGPCPADALPDLDDTLTALGVRQWAVDAWAALGVARPIPAGVEDAVVSLEAAAKRTR